MAAKELCAKDLMQQNVITVPEGMDAWELARLFTERGITGAPVVDGGGQLVGVVSQTDLLRHFGELSQLAHRAMDFYDQQDEGDFRGLRAATARDLMSAEVIDAGPDTPASELGRLMVLRRIHRLIITQERRIMGIVTTTDLLKAL